MREAVQHVYQYSMDCGTLEPARNFVNARTAGLPSPRSRHYAAITDSKQLGQLPRDIQAYKGNVLTRAALQLSPPCCSNGPVNCDWLIGRTSALSTRSGAVRPRR